MADTGHIFTRKTENLLQKTAHPLCVDVSFRKIASVEYQRMETCVNSVTKCMNAVHPSELLRATLVVIEAI